MASFSYSRTCADIVEEINQLLNPYFNRSPNITYNDVLELSRTCQVETEAQEGNKYSEPMVEIGIYIAIVSFLCVLAMAADLLHGLQINKLWFPCKYFSLNAVTMKLPLDLNSPMPTYMDQAAKLGSLAFMCTMMANLMPSLATMDNKTLRANVIGLSILVITVIANVCIEIKTSLISDYVVDVVGFFGIFGYGYDQVDYHTANHCVMVACIYMVFILLLLFIMVSASLAIPTSKRILELKFQATNKTFLTNQSMQHTQMSIVQKLRQHVRRYWVMAETGNPQFVMASNPLSTASGVICATVVLLNLLLMFRFPFENLGDSEFYGSPYKRSLLAIIITQYIGVAVGTVAPVSRCFGVLNFNFVTKWNWDNFMVFKVEKYWIQTLCDWKQNHIPFLLRSRISKTLFYHSKNKILSFCIGFQKVIVVSCKLIWLVAIVIPRFVIYHLSFWKSRNVAPMTDYADEDISICVININDKMKLDEKTLKGMLNSMNSFIFKAENEQNDNLLELLQKSTGFNGVESFDTDHVQSLLSVELVNSWSLPIVTLTCIAVSLPNIRKDAVESLLKSVGEGLSFTHHVEEILNNASEYVNIRNATMTLWDEVENNSKWLKNSLAQNAFKGKTATEILKWFSDKAKEIVIEMKESTNGEMVENTPNKDLIAANSMYRITQTILFRYQSDVEPIRKKRLFAILSGMIADIMCACSTNIARAITMKCHESVIETREASVRDAAKLFGKTKKIIERLETRELPSMDQEKMAYMDQEKMAYIDSLIRGNLS